MNEEELFCKLFPEYAVNGKPLSPYFDLFESGVEQSENRIKELEKKISVLFSCKNCPENKGGFICQKEYENKCLAQKIQFIKELQEENAELDCQKNRNKFCYSCANATEKCFKNEIGCPCDKYKSYKDENAELKEKLGNVQMQKAGEKSDLVWKLKTANEQKADQLTKAKELLKWWVNHCGDHDLFYAEKTEKFLREVNK